MGDLDRVDEENITTVAKTILIVGIIAIHAYFPILGAITLPVGLLAVLWLFWRTKFDFYELETDILGRLPYV